jgi:hypothetical protein
MQLELHDEGAMDGKARLNAGYRMLRAAGGRLGHIRRALAELVFAALAVPDQREAPEENATDGWKTDSEIAKDLGAWTSTTSRRDGTSWRGRSTPFRPLNPWG